MANFFCENPLVKPFYVAEAGVLGLWGYLVSRATFDAHSSQLLADANKVFTFYFSQGTDLLHIPLKQLSPYMRALIDHKTSLGTTPPDAFWGTALATTIAFCRLRNTAHEPQDTIDVAFDTATTFGAFALPHLYRIVQGIDENGAFIQALTHSHNFHDAFINLPTAFQVEALGLAALGILGVLAIGQTAFDVFLEKWQITTRKNIDLAKKLHKATLKKPKAPQLLAELEKLW